MKIEKIADNKIRIIIDIDELAKKNIDFLNLTQNTDEAQKLFKKILKQAEKEVDFHVEDSKLLIEAFVSSEGFFVVTFTKISTEHDEPIGAPLKLKVKRKMPSSSCKTAIYKFDSFDDFCNFCTYLNNTTLGDLKSLAKNISLYEYDSKYFLVFNSINTEFKDLSSFYISISEFAKLVSNSSNFNSKLREYGNVILKNNAIKYGIKYFKNPV